MEKIGQQREGFRAPLQDIERADFPFILSQYRQDAIEHLFTEMVAGRDVREICGEEKMPSYKMVRRWLTTNEAFRTHFIEVSKAAVIPEILECIHIADGTDWINRQLQAAKAKADDPEVDVKALIPKPVDLRHAKLRIETRLKFGERLMPELFGKGRDRQRETVTGDMLSALFQAAAKNGHQLPEEIVIEEEQHTPEWGGA